MGDIEYEKSTIKTQSIILVFTNGSPKAQDEGPACLKDLPI
jgi:hypothetical protein